MPEIKMLEEAIEFVSGSSASKIINVGSEEFAIIGGFMNGLPCITLAKGGYNVMEDSDEETKKEALKQIAESGLTITFNSAAVAGTFLSHMIDAVDRTIRLAIEDNPYSDDEDTSSEESDLPE